LQSNKKTRKATNTSIFRDH